MLTTPGSQRLRGKPGNPKELAVYPEVAHHSLKVACNHRPPAFQVPHELHDAVLSAKGKGCEPRCRGGLRSGSGLQAGRAALARQI